MASYVVDINVDDHCVALLTYVVTTVGDPQSADAGVVQVQQWFKVIAESDGSELLKVQIRNPTAAHLINVGSFCDRKSRVMNNKYGCCLPAEVRSECCNMPPVLATDPVGGDGGAHTPKGADVFRILGPVELPFLKVGDVIGLQDCSSARSNENDDIDMDAKTTTSAFENICIVVDVNDHDKICLLSLTSCPGCDDKKRLFADELTTNDGDEDRVWRLAGFGVPTIANVPLLKQVFDTDASLVVMPSDAERARARKAMQEERSRAEMLDALFEKAKTDAGPKWDVKELPPPSNLRRGVALKDLLKNANIYKAHASLFDEAIAMRYIFPAFHQYKVEKRPFRVGNKDVHRQVLVVKEEDGSVHEIEGVENITKYVANDANKYVSSNL